MLSKPEIERYYNSGDITIDPFVPENVGSAQVDITLGEFIYRETDIDQMVKQANPNVLSPIYNPYDEEHVLARFQLGRGVRHDEWVKQGNHPLRGVSPDEEIILLQPGEMILAHTQEFIGGSCNFITTQMKARSTIGRNFLSVCKCLPPETEVRRSDGTPALLGEIRVGDKLLNVDRFGQSRSARVKAVNKSREPKTLLKIETARGRTLVCSSDHFLRVSRSDGLRTIKADELEIDDQMPVLMHWEPEKESSVTFHEARMLGYFAAEGNWQQYIVGFAKYAEKSEERNEIAESMKAVFPNAPQPHFYDRHVQFYSVDLAKEFARRFPEVSCLGKYKRIPRSLFSASKEAVRAFLKAYLRCDGHDRVSRNEVQTCSRSPDLIRDIALLAARVGAVPTFSQRHSGAADRLQHYGLYYGDDACRITNRVEDASRAAGVFIPDLLNAVKNKYSMTRSTMAGYAVTDRKSISRKRLDEIVSAFSKPIEELRPYTGDLSWDSVVRIEKQVIERADLVDITLDVESEEDSLFVLSDGLMVLNCAGQGDVGYANRWTMEIINHNRTAAIPLVVGRRIAQILFFKVKPVHKADTYEKTGKYQPTGTLADLKKKWTPEMMLPRMDKDRESRKARGE